MIDQAIGVNWGITRRHLLGDPIPQTGRWKTWYRHYSQCSTSVVVYPILSDTAAPDVHRALDDGEQS